MGVFKQGPYFSAIYDPDGTFAKCILIGTYDSALQAARARRDYFLAHPHLIHLRNNNSVPEKESTGVKEDAKDHAGPKHRPWRPPAATPSNKAKEAAQKNFSVKTDPDVGVEDASEAPGEIEEWKSEGHAWIGRRVARYWEASERSSANVVRGMIKM